MTIPTKIQVINDDDPILNMNKILSEDYLNGIMIAIFIFYPNSYAISDPPPLFIYKKDLINKIAAYDHIESCRALKGELIDNYEYRDLTPDDGTTALRIWDGTDDYYNLIQTDNVNEFLLGFIAINNYFSCDPKSYILGPPILSEGEVSHTPTILDL